MGDIIGKFGGSSSDPLLTIPDDSSMITNHTSKTNHANTIQSAFNTTYSTSRARGDVNNSSNVSRLIDKTRDSALDEQ
eukprot:scaffold1599_cov75-Skeletonema_dohrnii-CCMP3373.AAC.1